MLGTRQGGQFDPGRITAPTVVRPSVTVPPVNTAHRANTGPRESAGHAPNTTVHAARPASAGKGRPGKPADRKPNTDRKGPTGRTDPAPTGHTNK